MQFVLDPTSPSGFREVTQFSPEMQALMQQNQDLTAQWGATTGEQLGRVDDRLGETFSFDAGRGAVLSDLKRSMMDPLWERKRDQLETQLANEGIRQGSEAYAERMRQFEQQSGDAYNKLFLDSYTMANDAALKEWLLPLTEMGMLTAAGSGAAMPSLPQFGQPAGPGVAPTDLTGTVMQAYQHEAANANAAMGGLYGLGSAALGGWAQAGFPGLAAGLALISDRRLKTDIERIGDDPRGWGVFSFRYVWGPERFIGYMADEVEPIRPDAVVTGPDGFKAIRYDLLA